MPTLPDHSRTDFLRIIAIDSSGGNGSVAAVGGERGVEIVEELPTASEHAKLTAAAVLRVARAAGWSIRDVDCVAVVRGPGSFTGLRVGVATAKAIAWAAPTKLVGVSAFECVARRFRTLHGVPPDGRMAIPFDAGRGEVFVAEAVFAAAPETAITISSGRLVNGTAWVASLPPGACVAGPAVELLAEPLQERGDLRIARPEAWQPRATAVAEAARARLESGGCDDPRSLVPEYARPSYAEEPKQARPAADAASGGSVGPG